MNKFDILIIGSGPGGYRTAEHAARKGLTVAVFEKDQPGGTCLNSGCIPTKTLCKHAEVADTVREAAQYGVKLENAAFDIDMQAVVARKEEVTEKLRQGIEQLMAMPGITFVRGEARFTANKTVVCNGEEYTADNIIIASGSSAKVLPVEGAQLKGVITSTELLCLDHVPHSLCIIGAGVIGMEFASIYRSFGCEVTVVEFLKECLPALDSDIAKRLRKQLEQRGVQFALQSGVTNIEQLEGNTLRVHYQKKGKDAFADAELVLMATGRAANVGSLSLENTEIAYTKAGITVDENMQTNVPGVYAIGDVNGKQMLAHAATFQGFRAVNHIVGHADRILFNIVPAAIFTHPEVGSVGLSEDQCKEQGIAYKCRKGYYRSNGKAHAGNATEGMIKLMTDENDRILGCHLYGENAAFIAQEVAVLMNFGATLSQLGEIVHTHPTLSEILQDMAFMP